ncbi:hypothetical protein J8G26_03470 [Acidovorax sp. JG5]|uniref:calcium-binding protein n=1 Tax=Acidovorax sp. JG5 TaxID=2822718 RepID=UPI001B3240F8|nr:hypothetical protein [Acidovorax sp. JG5]MBP3979793.1 hypothetical protein [Acidovorax sp. JG5]
MTRDLRTITGNARNNYLYGSSADESMNGGLGDDYLRGYGGDDFLTGGQGADRFVFERTQAANGIDTIEDYNYGQSDVLDLSLVGFARGVFNRGPLNKVIRIVPGEDDGDPAQLLIDVDGGGNSFQTWARLEGLDLGDTVKIRVGANLYDVPVARPPQPLITAFAVSEVNELSVTANGAATAALYAWDTEGGVGPLITGTSTSLNANTPGFITVSAQTDVTEAVLRLADGGAPTPDTHVFLGTAGADTVWGSDAADMIFGFGDYDAVSGGGGADTVQGGAGNDYIMGGEDNDVLHGDEGDDYLLGEAGVDVLYGGAGSDWLEGGAGVDNLYGGEGSDAFGFNATDLDTTAGLVTDIIQDFVSTDYDMIYGSFGAATESNYAEAEAAVATLADLLTDAGVVLDGAVTYYVGQVAGGDAYLVTDDDGSGYTEVIQLVGVSLNGISWESIVDFQD